MIIKEIETQAHTFLVGNEEIGPQLDNLLVEIIGQEDTVVLEGCDDEQVFQQIDMLFNQKD